MKYFTIAELSRSAKASSLGIYNTLPAGVTIALTALVDNVLDPLRSKYGRPITNNMMKLPTVANGYIKLLK